jgi:hypothetical protein
MGLFGLTTLLPFQNTLARQTEALAGPIVRHLVLAKGHKPVQRSAWLRPIDQKPKIAGEN